MFGGGHGGGGEVQGAASPTAATSYPAVGKGVPPARFAGTATLALYIYARNPCAGPARESLFEFCISRATAFLYAIRAAIYVSQSPTPPHATTSTAACIGAMIGAHGLGSAVPC